MIRILLADDHETVRAGLRLLVDAQDDMCVVGEAATGDEAVSQVQALRPDVAILDLTMPGIGGLGAARALRAAANQTPIVVLTRHSDEAFVRELVATGRASYVLKSSHSSEFLQAIRAAMSGATYVDPALTGREAPRPVSAPRVTNREQEVLRLTAVGRGNKEIASLLGISIKTVEVHKTNGMRKLNLGGRADVVRYAAAQGWLKDP